MAQQNASLLRSLNFNNKIISTHIFIITIIINSPSSRFVSVANHACKEVGIFRKTTTSSKQILR